MTKARKTKTTFEQAVQDYTAWFNTAPTIHQIFEFYYEYGKNWKLYDGFKDWMVYYTA